MREIKFRAIIPGRNAKIYFTLSDLIDPLFSAREILIPWLSDGNIPDQFTGLTDKNGKEIYDEDIVRIKHPMDKTGDFSDTVGRVFWWDEEAAFYHGNSRGRPPKRMWKYCEVIGNVYENPELLEGA